MHTDPASLAHRAAQRLTDLDPRLPEQVDRAILAGAAGGPPTRFIDPATGIALAALVVSIAQLGWQIYHDLK